MAWNPPAATHSSLTPSPTPSLTHPCAAAVAATVAVAVGPEPEEKPRPARATGVTSGPTRADDALGAGAGLAQPLWVSAREGGGAETTAGAGPGFGPGCEGEARGGWGRWV